MRRAHPIFLVAALAALAALAACSGGGGGECTGVGDAGAAATGATLTAGGQTFTYEGFIWGENNDCGMGSVTITGPQVTPVATGFGIGLCIPVPARIGAGPTTLADRNVVELVGASASADGCRFLPAAAARPSGTVTFGGFCTTPGATFTMSFAAQVAGTQTCGDAGVPEPTTLELGGTALVTPR
jgi:hypothetical protein